MSKILHLQGAHIKQEYDFAYETFADLDKLPRSQQISQLVKGHRWQARSSTYPKNDCGLQRTGGLVQWTEMTCGSPHPISGTICRTALANDEVLWQWRTGSVLACRFESLRESRAFWNYIFSNMEESSISTKEVTGLIVGDRVRFKMNVAVSQPSTFEFLGFSSSHSSWRFEKDHEVRVADVSEDGKFFIATPVDGYDAIRIPGTGGAKLIKSFGWISSEAIEISKKME